jgi:MtN3 and saliva related transmembrane protein
MSVTELIGHVAGFLTTVAFLPQAIKVWRSKSAHDISVGMYGVFIAGLLCWLVYGWRLQAWPIVIANSLTIVLAGGVLGMKLRYDARASNAERAKP